MFGSQQWKRAREIALVLFLIAAAIVLTAIWDFGLWDKLPFSLSIRLSYWADTLGNLNWLGHGIGSFLGSYPSFASIDTMVSRTDHAHNDFIEWVFELGLVGAVLLVALVVVAVRSDLGDRDLAVVVALGVEMLFAFPLHLPCTAFVGAVLLGHLCRNGDRVWGRFPYRREILSTRHG